MKKTLLLFFCSFQVLFAQHKMATLFSKSDIILEGRVLKVHAQKEQQNIYSTIEIGVENQFKGEALSVLRFKQLGGEVEDFVVLPTHQAEFKQGEHLILFFDSQTQSVVSGDDGKWEIQAQYLPKVQQNIAKTRLFLQETAQRSLAQQQLNIVAFQKSAVHHKVSATIASFSPTKAAAGTGTLVVLEGSGFGATQGTGKVEFTKSDTETLHATVVTWSDNKIRVLVPFGASSGVIQVTANDGSISQTATPFEVSFSSAMRKWGGKNVTVPYRINPNNPNITNQQEINGITAAFNTWNAVNSNLQFSYLGQTTTTTEVANSVNEIFWKNMDGVGGILARNTLYFYKISGTIVESDIAFDAAETWSLNPDVLNPDLNAFDVESVALHELGHSVFLNDIHGTADEPKTMFAGFAAGEIKRTLHTDDILGIQSVYGPEQGANSLGGNANFNSTAAIAFAEDAPQFAVGQANDTFTLEAWIYPQGLPTDLGLIAGQSNFLNERAYELFFGSNGKIVFNISSDGTALQTLSSSQQIPLNQWTHVRAVLLKNPSNANRYLAIYINGVLDIEGSAGTSNLFNSSAKFSVGGHYILSHNSMYLFNGKIDEVRLSTIPRIFSVLSVVKHGIPFSFDTDAQTVGLWKLDELVNVSKNTSLGRYLDYSGLANNDLHVYVVALPIALTSFKVWQTENEIALNWTLGSVENINYFVVEEWLGETFKSIGEVPVAGLSYHFQNNNLMSGLRTYRIKAVYKNGDIEYSEPRTLLLEFADAVALSKVYPNPILQEAQFQVAVAKQQRVEITLFDALGRKLQTIWQGEMQANEIENIRLSLNSLSSGMYFMQVKGRYFVQHQSIVKQ